MSTASPILNIKPLGPRWETLDPFLFCVYHDDAYPEANADMSPKASLAGRDIGQDFSRKDGWSMYHGQTVPGFPGHPHRGFETVSIVRKGLIDHSDSLGAIARFGQGDVQWLTAGRGIVHAEMFPLLKEDTDNRMEMFQIWLNLPAVSKMAPPHFKMFWAEEIPDTVAKDEQGRATHVSVVAGKLKAGNEAIDPLAPPPDSWAAREHADLAIWTLRMEPGAKWTLPAALKGTNRVLYFFKGKSVTVAGQSVNSSGAIQLQADAAVELVNGDTVSEFLVLQGKPIGEPVVQYGPFVMNSQAEIVQTMQEYQRTRFGGWPWDDYAPTHGRDPARFAKHPDGKEDRPQVETAAA
ncbi:MAG: pirin family protein [Pseudomonadota bacterium]